MIIVTDKYGHIGATSKKNDLCPDCMRSLTNFMEVPHREAKESNNKQYYEAYAHGIADLYRSFRYVGFDYDEAFELCDPPINAQFALDLIFKTLINDKKHYPYLTTMP